MRTSSLWQGEITIPFDEGFTAITGPNGSGKSNSRRDSIRTEHVRQK